MQLFPIFKHFQSTRYIDKNSDLFDVKTIVFEPKEVKKEVKKVEPVKEVKKPVQEPFKKVKKVKPVKEVKKLLNP